MVFSTNTAGEPASSRRFGTASILDRRTEGRGDDAACRTGGATTSSLSLDRAPVVIIGAGRSGTNMLRDALVRLGDATTWPCDEINYIWRHGNRACESDEFTSDMATPAVRRYIRERFASIAGAGEGGTASPVVIEKTCANALRVPFVDEVLPEARYVHIVRDGRDVVASARRRWTAPLDIPYLAAKARYVPTSDLPYYASRYFVNRVQKLFHAESRLSVWGPRFKGRRELARTRSLDHVCAAQWVRCVTLADRAFASMPAGKVIRVRYEDLIRTPLESLESIATFLDLPHRRASLSEAAAEIRPVSTFGRTAGEADDGDELIELMRDTLLAHGYDPDS